jgi:Ca2+-binding RTX toxin-like protein
MSDWTSAVNGNWSDATKWTGGVPNAAGAVANFTVANAAAGVPVTIRFSQNATFSVGTLNIAADSNDGWQFLGEVGVTNATLRFDGVGNSPAFLNVDTNGSDVLSSINNSFGLNVVLDDDLIVTTQDSDTSFRIVAPITGSKDIYKFGDGTLQLNSANNVNWTGDLHLNGGRVELTSSTALASVGAIKLNNGATLAVAASSFELAEKIETGTGNATGNIVVATGSALSLSGQLELRSNASDAVTFGSATDAGTIVLSGTSLINGTGSFNVAGGTVRFGNAGAAASYFAGLTGSADVGIAADAIFDTGGFAATLHNFNLNGGTLQSTGGALNLTTDIVGFALFGETGTIVGTAQADSLVFNVAQNVSLTLAGALTFTNWTGGVDTITMNALGAAILQGSAQNETFNGSAGNDTLVSNGGADIMRGGAGDDQYTIVNALSTLIENASEGTDTITIGSGGPTVFTLDANFENLTFSGSAQHTGIGNAADNVLTGGQGVDDLQGLAGNDTLLGGLGNDTLNGGLGADQMEGRIGDDFFFVDSAGDTVVELAGEGNDRIFAGLSYTLAAGASVEMMTTTSHAGTAAINLTGNELVNTIFGNAGANLLDGKAGADTLVGLAGDDFYHVDAAADRVAETAGEGSDRVFASASYTLGAGVSVELMTTNANAGTTAINLTGNELANTIYGNAGANTLDGRGGVDALVGLAGDDFYHVDNAADRAIEATGEGSDRVFASVSFTLGAGSSVELMTTNSHAGTAAIDLIGNELANTIFGNAGINLLDGRGGGDVLVGQAGADSFAFTTALGAGNVDRIVDFVSGGDTIALDNAVFTQIGGPGALSANAFVTGTGAADADDRIVYNQAAGQLFYDADGNGAGAAVLFATLDGNPALAASDFQVI